MNISAYILEYLKRFGTVVVPGFGVFSLESSKAIINSENGSILPPSNQIAFELDYKVQGDDLIEFIQEQKKESREAVKNELEIQTDFWKKKLQADQSLEIPRLGVLSLSEGKSHFKGNRLEAEHPDFYGLEEIRISDIKNTEKADHSEQSDKDYKFNRSVLWIFLILIPVLGIAYLAYTQQEFLFGKKSFENVTVQTKTHRIAEDTVKLKKDSLNTIIVSDSLPKDSLKPAATGVNLKPATKQ
ncbi:HU domain-containing protein [Chryseobacterium sp. CT-SW4]|uniref:HU domain-containing protein n=1 Tax=Chryseobacterium sp. SW-1 TaxID=3157343 RepID=UPI003B017CD9